MFRNGFHLASGNDEKAKLMIALNVFKQLLAENNDHFRLLTLDEFFSENSEEDSIAPNQWGYGRPPLAEIWEILRKIELISNVEWVRVTLHYDTEIIEDNGTEILNLAGESIMVCTDMEADEMEEIVNCEWLCSDGIIKSNPALYYSRIPPIPQNYNCFEIVWD